MPCRAPDVSTSPPRRTAGHSSRASGCGTCSRASTPRPIRSSPSRRPRRYRPPGIRHRRLRERPARSPMIPCTTSSGRTDRFPTLRHGRAPRVQGSTSRWSTPGSIARIRTSQHTPPRALAHSGAPERCPRELVASTPTVTGPTWRVSPQPAPATASASRVWLRWPPSSPCGCSEKRAPAGTSTWQRESPGRWTPAPRW